MVFPCFILHEVERLLDVTDNNACSHRIKTHDEVGKFLKEESLSVKQFIVGIKKNCSENVLTILTAGSIRKENHKLVATGQASKYKCLGNL